jgi:hypothetical protein
MHFITLLFFFPFLQSDSDPVEPFDSTGISYHEKMSELIPSLSISFPGYETFAEKEPYATAIKKSNVKKYVSHREEWKFDRNGNLVEYFERNNYHRWKYGKYQDKSTYKYDNKNYLKETDDYDLSVFISRGTYVSKTHDKIIYDYDAHHLVCKESGKELNYSNIADRIVGFEPELKYSGIDSLDNNGRIVSYTGYYFNHAAFVKYIYDGNDLTKRTIFFTDCNAGVIDSIPYAFSGNNKIGKHYFSLIISGQPMKYILLETIVLNASGKIIDLLLDPNSRFPIYWYQDFRCFHYSAVYNGDSLMEENEFDSLGRCYTRKIYSYGISEKNHFVRYIEFGPSDTIGGIDTFNIKTTYYNQYGLFVATAGKGFIDRFENDHYHPVFYEKPNEWSYSMHYKHFLL